MSGIADIVDFWFSQRVRDLWWRKDAAFDEEIRRNFEPVHRQAATKALDGWLDTRDGALALVLALDQFPRNMYRDTPKAFATDAAALKAAGAALARGHDLAFPDSDSRIFLYLPFEHSESLADQRRAVDLVRERIGEGTYLDFALAHLEVIAKYGRFPHRNRILGRRNTPEEEEYLKDPNAGF